MEENTGRGEVGKERGRWRERGKRGETERGEKMRRRRKWRKKKKEVKEEW